MEELLAVLSVFFFLDLIISIGYSFIESRVCQTNCHSINNRTGRITMSWIRPSCKAASILDWQILIIMIITAALDYYDEVNRELYGFIWYMDDEFCHYNFRSARRCLLFSFSFCFFFSFELFPMPFFPL